MSAGLVTLQTPSYTLRQTGPNSSQGSAKTDFSQQRQRWFVLRRSVEVSEGLWRLVLRVRVAGSCSSVFISWRPEGTFSPTGGVLLTQVTPPTETDLRVPGVPTRLTGSHGGHSWTWMLPMAFPTAVLGMKGFSIGVRKLPPTQQALVQLTSSVPWAATVAAKQTSN